MLWAIEFSKTRTAPWLADCIYLTMDSSWGMSDFKFKIRTQACHFFIGALKKLYLHNNPFHTHSCIGPIHYKGVFCQNCNFSSPNSWYMPLASSVIMRQRETKTFHILIGCQKKLHMLSTFSIVKFAPSTYMLSRYFVKIANFLSPIPSFIH